MKRRVVLTGAGVISALGHSRFNLYNGLAAGASGVRAMPEWAGEMAGGDTVCAAPVSVPASMAKSIERHYRRSMGNAALFAALAAKSAVAESGLNAEVLGNGRAGCAASSTVGSASSMLEGMRAILEKRFEDLSACHFFRVASHSSAFNVANCLGIRGVQLSPCSACASSMQSIGLAYEQILFGRQDVMIAGGADEATASVADSFMQLNALAFAPERDARRWSCPFDAERCGLVCGEGAGMLVLEEHGHAMARGANILGEILGYATNCTGAQISQSDNKSIETCMRLALEDAGLPATSIDYVNAHATGTVAGDREEAAAIRSVFGGNVPVSSFKGNIGHTMGASGAMELAAILEMMKNETILPTLNLAKVAEDCAGLRLPSSNEKAKVDFVLKNCIAFGGVNSSIVLGKYGK